MRGLWEHFKLTLLLNLRSRQALVYGYLVPVFFLVAFGSIFRGENPPLLRELGQLLTITVLGGACFGMPTAMVAERERGVWRRYRLLPAATGTLVISTMAARYLIVLSAAVMQVILARLMYGMPMPEHPLGIIVGFTCVTLAFLGMGLVIAMLAENVPAVQALGQAIFLPMIMIGGVGVPLWTLPAWARHVAAFLPGKYAVSALQACATSGGLAGEGFDVAALLVIGAGALLAGAKMFRWDAHEKVMRGKRGWGLLAVLVWASVGVAAELTGRALAIPGEQPQATGVLTTTLTNFGTGEPFEGITRDQIESLKYDDLPWDDGTVTPVAKGIDKLPPEQKQRAEQIRQQLEDWRPGKNPSVTRRVLNLLDAASVADIQKDPYEGVFAYLVFEKLKRDVPKEELEKVLTWLILHPEDEKAIRAVPELGVDGESPAEEMPDRVRIYSLKLVGRLDEKLPATK